MVTYKSIGCLKPTFTLSTYVISERDDRVAVPYVVLDELMLLYQVPSIIDFINVYFARCSD